MKTINRLMTNICSADLHCSKSFYTSLFDFDINYDSDWFVHLISKDKNLEIGIISKTSDLVPIEYQNTPTGFYITMVVDSVDEVYDLAKASNFEVVSKPEDTFYGQRRMLVKDPDGALIDISSVIQ